MPTVSKKCMSFLFQHYPVLNMIFKCICIDALSNKTANMLWNLHIPAKEFWVFVNAVMLISNLNKFYKDTFITGKFSI